MLTERSILCPVDFSEQSRAALLWALSIARHRGAELTVLSVVDPLLADAADVRLGVDLARHTEPALREFVDAVVGEPERGDLRPRMQVAVGDPAEAILDAAHRLDTDLIVIGTHGRGGFRKLMLGSTTEQVLRRTEWPVLAVPAGAVSAPDVQHPGIQLGTILLATDFRESAMAAGQWASELASEIGIPVVLSHVVESVVLPSSWQSLGADFESDRVASGQRMLERLSASFQGIDTECAVSVGRPAETIALLAVEHGAGLVVMGLANTEDAEPRRAGSIAYRVLRTAHVAVVVVPARAVTEPQPARSVVVKGAAT